MGILDSLRSNLRGSKIVKAFSGIATPQLQTSIYVDPAGIGVAFDPSIIDRVFDCPWSDINTIVAFKRDLFTVDLLCLRIEAVSGQIFEVNEEMGGWSALLEALPNYLQGCMTKQQVLDAIVNPAFATNQTKVYSRL